MINNANESYLVVINLTKNFNKKIYKKFTKITLKHYNSNLSDLIVFLYK
jgi:hypothetical protein